MDMSILISGFVLGLVILLPLSIKWELDKRFTLPAICLIGLVSGSIGGGIATSSDLSSFYIIIIEIMLIGIISISLLMWRFYRDPERTPPDDKNIFLAPADGKVVYVRNFAEGEIPYCEKKGRTYLLDDFVKSDVLPMRGSIIGIGMSFLDVHVNRAPIGGTVSALKHIRGVFCSLKKWEAILENERSLIVVDHDDFKLGIVMIASRLVRKIVPYVIQGRNIKAGERIGRIRFGSQVDLIIPDLPSLDVKVEPGDRVTAGVSIVAKYAQAESSMR